MLTTFALITAGLFTGAAAYVNAVEQPARLKLDAGPLLTEWKTAYQRGTVMQGGLALVGAVLGVAAYFLEGREPLALVGSALMLANWPWSMLVVLPTNKRLMAVAPEQAGEAERGLIGRWAGLHAARTMLGALATTVFATLLV